VLLCSPSLIATMAVLSVLVLSGSPASASTDLPAGYAESFVAGGFPNPTVLRFAPDGRLFVAGKQGEIWIVHEGDVRPASPALQLDVDYQGERGLVGIAFDPDYAADGFIYLQYTATTPTIHNRVSRFTVDGDRIDPASEQILIELEPQEATYHVGGALEFGADGKLYVGTGDNVRGMDAQSLESLLGKVLRINRDGSIPEDNPFFARTDGSARAIWAYGLRNAYTIARDPGSDRIFVNDTGQDTAEEINLLERGGNYGWPETEGYFEGSKFIKPLYAYPHQGGKEVQCAIDGGVFYRPETPTFPADLQGKYLFIDYCASWLNMLDPATGAVQTLATGLGDFGAPVSEVVGLTVGPDGAVYRLNRSSGSIYRIQYTGSTSPFVGTDPRRQVVQAGSVATFGIRASGAGSLSYQWTQDGTDIPGATSPVLQVLGLPANNGAKFACLVRNASGAVSSKPATLRVVLPHAHYKVLPPVTWLSGHPQRYMITLTNIGLAAWNAGGDNQVRLGVYFQRYGDPVVAYQITDQRVALPEDVPPGASVDVWVTASPPEAGGTYLLRHELVKEGIAWFGDGLQNQVVVQAKLSPLFLAALAGSVLLIGVLVLAWLRRSWAE